MRDFARSELMSVRAEKSKRPPTRRNSRISEARVCWRWIQSGSVDGARDSTRALPRGEDANPRRSSRRESNSRTRAEVWSRAEDITSYVTGEISAQAAGRIRRRLTTANTE